MTSTNLAESFTALDAQQGLGGRVQLQGVDTPMPNLLIQTDSCMGLMYLHGAHVAAWQPAGGAPVLFQSGSSRYTPGQPIRGGVPVIFPWFGPHPTDDNQPPHGLVRTRAWELADIKAVGDAVTVTMTLAADDETRAAWPFDFQARLTATFDRTLHLALEITNTGDEEFDFEEALHTYFTVGDVKQVGVSGLAGTTYIDKVDEMQRKTEGTEPIAFTAETDRVYVDTEAECVIADGSMGRSIAVAKTGSRSTVVWNPWSAKSVKMPDFGDAEWPGMVCVETANAADNRVALEPGSTHEMAITLSVV